MLSGYGDDPRVVCCVLFVPLLSSPIPRTLAIVKAPIVIINRNSCLRLRKYRGMAFLRLGSKTV